MKQYFLKNGTRESGPYLLDDLKYQRIKPDTLIKEENGEWHPISANRDLRFLLNGQQGGSVEFSNQSETTQQQTTQEKFMTLEEITKLADPARKIQRTIRLAILLAVTFAILGAALSVFLAFKAN